MHISDRFDSGNIEVVQATTPGDIQLRIRQDAGDEHMQWFHYRVTGAKGQALRMRLLNASKVSYPNAWQGYQAVASYDRKTWLRVPTSFVNGELVIEHTPEHDSCSYAYFAPYSLEQHRDLVAACGMHARVKHEVLGRTLDGRDLDLLTIGEPVDGRSVIWVIARQHPGESMASWFMQGFLARLLDSADPVARALLNRAVFHVVPHMNPDGSFRGHLRCNAIGANLNREWHAPMAERSPEVLLVRDRMDATGVDLCLDVHGDEALPYNFIAGPDGIPSLSATQRSRIDAFLAAYSLATPDFQTAHGYPRTAPGQANMSMCTNQTAERYGCLSMTLEMPFKDNAELPDPVQGWSPVRCERLGAAALHPLLADVRAQR